MAQRLGQALGSSPSSTPKPDFLLTSMVERGSGPSGWTQLSQAFRLSLLLGTLVREDPGGSPPPTGDEGVVVAALLEPLPHRTRGPTGLATATGRLQEPHSTHVRTRPWLTGDTGGNQRPGGACEGRERGPWPEGAVGALSAGDKLKRCFRGGRARDVACSATHVHFPPSSLRVPWGKQRMDPVLEPCTLVGDPGKLLVLTWPINTV